MRYKKDRPVSSCIYIRAEITVFLTLLFGIVSALAITVIESARNQASRVQVERTMITSIHSCFSEYNQDLLKYYEIFAIDSSYRGPTGSVDNVLEHLKEYANDNFSSSDKTRSGSEWLKLSVANAYFDQYELLSDNNASPIWDQICEYMSVGELVSDKSEMSSIRDALSTRSNGGFMSSFSESLSRSGLGENNPAQAIFDIASANDPLGTVLFEGYGYVSVPSDRASGRTLASGNSKKGVSTKGPFADKEHLLNSYFIERLSDCVNKLSHSYMKAETEYLLFGNRDEAENVREVARWILASRESKNLVAMESNGYVLEETEELANRLCEEEGDPYYTQISLIYAWTYVESLIEVNRLFNGGKVGILSGIGGPTVPLSDLLEFSQYFGGGGSGYSYKKVLSGMLLYIDSVTKLKRFMDIIEMNMRSLGHSGFKVDTCITYFKAHMDVGSMYGHDCEIEREKGY